MSNAEAAMNSALLEARRLDVDIGSHRICRALDWRVEAGESGDEDGVNALRASRELA